jgi:hypothetical protein
MNIKQSIKKILITLNPFDSSSLKDTIYSLLNTDAVRVDVVDNRETCTYRPYDTFLRLTSTRELLTDEIRDDLLRGWQNTLNILSKDEQLKARFDFSAIQGLAIRQSDWGFDTHTLSFREDHHEHGNYRWPGCGF